MLAGAETMEGVMRRICKVPGCPNLGRIKSKGKFAAKCEKHHRNPAGTVAEIYTSGPERRAALARRVGQEELRVAKLEGDAYADEDYGDLFEANFSEIDIFI